MHITILWENTKKITLKKLKHQQKIKMEYYKNLFKRTKDYKGEIKQQKRHEI